MKIEEITNKKNSKQKLLNEEISFAVNGYVNGTINEKEMTAFIKSIYDNGMSDKEIFALTNVMLKSGDILDLTELGTVVDKHSTGGVSDTTTIIIVPICASLGVKMLKLSGRGLGFTGGTADKLESFNGYKTDIEISKAIQLVKKNNGCMMTTSLSLAPADKAIYSLRNKTGLVDNIPLITSSIMSKKLASGGDIIVLDVKYGNGAFMPNKKSAICLGRKMKRIGEMAGKRMKIVLGKMNQPLGYCVGPTLETMEAIRVLKNKEKGPLFKDSVKLASICVSMEKHISYLKAKKLVLNSIYSGEALNKLKTMIKDQGGSLDLFDEKNAPIPKIIVESNKSGRIKHFNTKMIGEIVADMGTVKRNADDTLFYNLGIKTFHKIGDKIKVGDKILEIYAKDIEQAKDVQEKILDCITLK